MDGCRDLWAAVISQAFMDACLRPTAHSHSEETVAQATASIWLMRSGRDFATVCHLAGIDPACVQQHGKKLELQGWPPRRVDFQSRYDRTVSEQA